MPVLLEVCVTSAVGQKWHLRKVGRNETDQNGKSWRVSHIAKPSVISRKLFLKCISVFWATLLLTLGRETFESHWSRDGGRRGHQIRMGDTVPAKMPPFCLSQERRVQSSMWGCLHAWGPWGHAAVGTFELGLGEYVGVCQIQKKREGEREALISGRK